MARTFTSIKTEALSNDFSSTTYGSLVEQWINDGLKEIARRVRLPLSQTSTFLTVVAGTASYNLPADFVRVESVVDTETGSELEAVSQTEIDELPEGSGTPILYALYGNTIALYPTPDAASTDRVRLRYLKLPADLSGVNPITGTVPDDYGDALVAYARWHLFRAEDDFELAPAWEGEFEKALVKLRADTSRRDGVRRQVPGMWGRGSTSPRFVRP